MNKLFQITCARSLSLTVVTLMCLSLIIGTATSVMAAEKTPPGSFLVYRASSTSQLIDQVKNNPTVAKRYARHFGKSQSELAGYFEKNLEVLTLDRPYKVKSYYIGRSGKVYTKTKLLPKGSVVFATPNDGPVLSWSCGNPLTSALAKNADKPVTKTKGSTEQIPPETKTLPIAPETIAAAAVTAPPGFVTEIAPALAVPQTLGAIAFPPIAVPPLLSASNPAFLLPLLGVPFLAPTPEPDPDPDPDPVVPEAGSTLLALSAVAPLGIAAARRRFKK